MDHPTSFCESDALSLDESADLSVRFNACVVCAPVSFEFYISF